MPGTHRLGGTVDREEEHCHWHSRDQLPTVTRPHSDMEMEPPRGKLMVTVHLGRRGLREAETPRPQGLGCGQFRAMPIPIPTPPAAGGRGTMSIHGHQPLESPQIHPLSPQPLGSPCPPPSPSSFGVPPLSIPPPHQHLGSPGCPSPSHPQPMGSIICLCPLSPAFGVPRVSILFPHQLLGSPQIHHFSPKPLGSPVSPSPLRLQWEHH